MFVQAFKPVAVELSYANGFVKIAAAELEIDPGRISKWRQHQNGSVTLLLRIQVFELNKQKADACRRS